MHTTESFELFLSEIAKAADLCFKPWRHSVISLHDPVESFSIYDKEIDLVLRIESRSEEGDRHPVNDLELEIYRSGLELNIVISLCNSEKSPILWQGKHSIWMDAASGKRCPAPSFSEPLEALARRLRNSINI